MFVEVYDIFPTCGWVGWKQKRGETKGRVTAATRADYTVYGDFKWTTRVLKAWMECSAVWLLLSTRIPPIKRTKRLTTTGWTRLIQNHSSARFCFELSGNWNYNMKLLLCLLIYDKFVSIFGRKLRVKCNIRINCNRIDGVSPVKLQPFFVKVKILKIVILIILSLSWARL